MSADYRNRSVAVTGASGYLGSALLAELQRLGARVLSISRRPIARGNSDDHLVGDIREESCWREIVDRASIVFHLAGNTSVQAAALNPDDSFQSTVLPIAHLASAARARGRRPRVVFTSTATVYGFTSEAPTSEQAPTSPQTVYDRHKLEAEQQLQAASTDIDGVSLRLSNVYGPSPAETSARDRGFLNRAAARAIAGHDLVVYGDGSYVRDFVHVDDVVRAMVSAGVHESTTSTCFNVGSGRGTSMHYALTLIANAASRGRGRAIEVREAAWPAESDPIDRRNFVADVTRIGIGLGWRPTITLEQGIETLMPSSGTETCASS